MATKSQIGFRPSYMEDETQTETAMPPMQQHAVDAPKEKSGILSEAENRLLAAKTFLLSPSFARMSNRSKGRKIQDVEFLTLVVAQLT